MEIKILGEHITVTEAIGNYIKTKFSHTSSPEKLNHVEFRIGKEKEFQYVRFNALCPNSGTIHLEAKDNNLYKAIDILTEKIQRSFIKNKELHNNHLHKNI